MERHASSRLGTTLASVAVLVFVAAACGGDPVGAPEAPASDPTAAEAPRGPSSERLVRHPTGSVDGAPVGYVEYVPLGYGDGELRPLLVFLHGGGEVGDGSANSLDLVLTHGIPATIQADRWPEARTFVVLAPQFSRDDCLWTDDLDRFVDFAIDRYDVDPERVYLTGISCGGIAVWNYLGEHLEKVAAAVIVSAQAIDALQSAGCELGRVPIWVVHGAKDDVVPVDFVEGQVEELRSCTDPEPVDLRFTVHEDLGHLGAWDPVYEGADADETFEWLLSHRNAA